MITQTYATLHQINASDESFVVPIMNILTQRNVMEAHTAAQRIFVFLLSQTSIIIAMMTLVIDNKIPESAKNDIITE